MKTTVKAQDLELNAPVVGEVIQYNGDGVAMTTTDLSSIITNSVGYSVVFSQQVSTTEGGFILVTHNLGVNISDVYLGRYGFILRGGSFGQFGSLGGFQYFNGNGRSTIYRHLWNNTNPLSPDVINRQPNQLRISAPSNGQTNPTEVVVMIIDFGIII